MDQVRLVDDVNRIVSVDVLRNELVVISDWEMKLIGCNLNDEDAYEAITHDSEISTTSDEALVPTGWQRLFWRIGHLINYVKSQKVE